MNDVFTQKNLKFNLNFKNTAIQPSIFIFSTKLAYSGKLFIFSAESLEPWFWDKTYVGLFSSYSAHTLVSFSVKWANNSFCSDLSFKNLS